MRRLIALFGLLASGAASAALPLGTATITSVSCAGAPWSTATNVNLPNTLCLSAAISGVQNGNVDGVSTAVASNTAAIKVSDPVGTPTGTIISLTGGSGAQWSENAFTAGVTGWMAPATTGKRFIQINWSGTSWDTGSVGPRVLANRVCTLIQAIHDNNGGFALYLAGTPFIVVGHSSGASLTAYCLGVYGLGTIIDSAILTSGPPHTRVDYGCYGNLNPTWAALCPTLTTAAGGVCVLDAATEPNIERSYQNRTRCRNPACVAGLDNECERDSIYRSDTLWDYPNTRVVQVLGDADTTVAAPLGDLWYTNYLRTSKSHSQTITTGSCNHNGVPSCASGITAIFNGINAATFNH